MGLPHLVAFQLLCPPLRCLLVNWKGLSVSVYFSVLLFDTNRFSCRFLNRSMQWLARRQAHLFRAQQGIPVSEYGVSLELFVIITLLLLSICLGSSNVGLISIVLHTRYWLI